MTEGRDVIGEAGTPRGVGERGRRVGGLPRVTGEFAFGSDLRTDGVLFGAVTRSPHPHARIVAIDTSVARVMPGVWAVLTADDLPAKRHYGLNEDDQPVLAGTEVNYVGEPVAMVGADSLRAARAAAAAVVVEYEVVPAVCDPEAALEPSAPEVHRGGNVLRRVYIEHGEPDVDADVWVEGYYETPAQDHAALGTEAALAVPAADGSIDVHVMSQWLHADLEQVAPCLGLPPEKVRLHLAGVGGSFGSREDVNVEIHAAVLARVTGRPVKFENTREESFHGHVHRHPSRFWMRHGATKDGRLVAVHARAVLDGGAYASTTLAVVANAAVFATGPYEVPNARIDATAVFTNNPPCGAMRGFGAVQPCFAYESQMDKLAAALGMDPVELRLRNVMRPGSVAPTGQVVNDSAPVGELLRRCAALPLPDEHVAAPWPGNTTHGEGVRRGVGYALGFKNIGYSEGFDDSCEIEASLVAGAHGPRVQVHSAAVDTGQGLTTVLVAVARTELGVHDVELHEADTGIGSAGSSSASRQTVMSAGALHQACGTVREELFGRVRGRTGAVDGPLALRDEQVWADGRPLAPIADFLDEPIVAREVYRHRKTQPLDERGQGDSRPYLAFVAVRAVVDVDVELGLTRVVQLAVVEDVGRAINPVGLEGQLEGGAAMGLGLAVMEELQVDGGVIRNASFTDYLIPTILDVPPVVTELVEVPEPETAYGANGVGEIATIATTPAVVAAIRNATGRPLTRVPVRPDDIIGLA